MKLIIAYIQPERLNEVKRFLYRASVFKMSVTNALGCGEEQGYHETYRGVDIEVTLLKKVRVEVAVNEAYLEQTIDAIVEGASTGTVGDGKILVVPLEDCIRIRAGQRGREGIG